MPGRGRGPAQADGVMHDHRHRGHGRQDAVHLRGGREGAERRHRTAARQPPARLPGLRQGRRVPAAEPDDDQRLLRVALSRCQAHLSQAHRDLGAGAARPRALRAVHADARASRSRSPATRSSRCSSARPSSRSPSSKTSRSTPTSPATPCRSARSARSPARSTGSGRDRSTWCHRRACASTARQAASSATTIGAARCCAGWPGSSRRSTKNGTATRAAGRSATPPRPTASIRRWCATSRGELVPTSWPEALRAAAAGLAAARAGAGAGVLDRRPPDRRRRLRLREIRPGGPRHERHRLPRPGALRRRGSPSCRRASPAASSTSPTPTSRRPRPCCSSASSPKKNRRSSSCGCARPPSRGRREVVSIAPFATRGLDKLLRPADRRRARAPRPRSCRRWPTTPRCPRRPVLTRGRTHRCSVQTAAALAVPGAVIVVGERLAGVPGALSAAAALADATGARLAWVPRRAGERGAVEAGALPNLLPGGRSISDADARAQVGLRWATTMPAKPGRDTAGIIAAAAAGKLGALVVAGVDPDDLPDPTAAHRGARRSVVRRQHRASANRGDRARRRGVSGRRRGREGRHVPRLGGSVAALRRVDQRHRPVARSRGARTRWPTHSTSISDCLTCAPRAPSCKRLAPQRPSRRRWRTPSQAGRRDQARAAAGGARQLARPARQRQLASRRALPRRDRQAVACPAVAGDGERVGRRRRRADHGEHRPRLDHARAARHADARRRGVGAHAVDRQRDSPHPRCRRRRRRPASQLAQPGGPRNERARVRRERLRGRRQPVGPP